MLGPPGAGKGTQARKLCTYYNYARISTGDMLRESVRKKTALGRKAKGYIETGALVPDRLVDAIVKARLARKDCENGFVLDGYPRTIPQAEFLDAVLGPALKGIAAMSAIPRSCTAKMMQPRLWRNGFRFIISRRSRWCITTGGAAAIMMWTANSPWRTSSRPCGR